MASSSSSTSSGAGSHPPLNAHEQFSRDVRDQSSSISAVIKPVLEQIKDKVTGFNRKPDGTFLVTLKESTTVRFQDGEKHKNAQLTFARQVSGKLTKGSLEFDRGSVRYQVQPTTGALSCTTWEGSAVSIKKEGDYSMKLTARVGKGYFKKEMATTIPIADLHTQITLSTTSPTSKESEERKEEASS